MGETLWSASPPAKGWYVKCNKIFFWRSSPLSGGRTYLAEQAQNLEAAVINLESRRPGEAIQAIAHRGEQVQQDLRHCVDSLFRY